MNDSMNKQAVIWWIRRDLRLRDNPALRAAVDSGYSIMPLFVFDPKLFDNTPKVRKNFLLEGLKKLNEELKKLGGAITFQTGTPEVVFSKLSQELVIKGVFAGEDYTPYSRQRDDLVSRIVPLQLINGITIQHPLQFLRGEGETYKSFTPFNRAWLAKPMHVYRAWLPDRPKFVKDYPTEDPYSSNPVDDFTAGEVEAEKRLQAFLDGPISVYREGRNRLDEDLTSSLSPYLKFGMLSPLRAYSLAQEKLAKASVLSEKESIMSWLSELVWREFYNLILFYYPHVLKTAFRDKYRAIAWQKNTRQFESWQQGLTGYPVVDAGMRQLLQTGWMHNRARMITASFLVKDLLIDWREGEKWFMKNLVDGDLAANNGGWQWTAGVGTDAAPYFRIFNPVTQGEKHDPMGRYIRRYVPELGNVPNEYIHQPWTMPLELQSASGCVIGKDYPGPIVDHAAARAKAMAIYSSK